MYAGRAVEDGPGARDLRRPAAPVHVGPARVDADDRAPARRRWSRSRGRRLRCSRRRPAAPFHPRCPYRFEPCDDRAARCCCEAPAATSTPATCRSTSKRARVGRARREPSRGLRRERHATSRSIEVEHLTKHFPVRQGVFARAQGGGARGRGRDADRAQGRDARHRRRVGLRQVDDGPADAAPARPDERARSASKGGTSRGSRSASCGRCAARCR